MASPPSTARSAFSVRHRQLPDKGTDHQRGNDFMTQVRIGIVQELTRGRKSDQLRAPSDRARSRQNTLGREERALWLYDFSATGACWLDRYYAEAMANRNAEQIEQVKREKGLRKRLPRRPGQSVQDDVIAAHGVLGAWRIAPANSTAHRHREDRLGARG